MSEYAIPFTQYKMPDGRKVGVSFETTGEDAKKADEIIKHGWRFETEVLSTREVSLTVFDPEAEVDIAIQVVKNGPAVPVAVSRLINLAHIEMLAKATEAPAAPVSTPPEIPEWKDRPLTGF